MVAREDGKYRPEIDGLRALAVLSVVFYHLEFQAFSGGFVGVDVFFVVSGFLITRLILDECVRGAFTFPEFYVRRIRRLCPALFATFLLTVVFGFLLFSPNHLERLGGSLLYSLFSASNVYFWSEAGYFDSSADIKPLLHMWSLSVEEQFYFVWPVVLFLLLKVRTAWVVPSFLVLSGALSLYYAEEWVRVDREGAFYLAPFRVFEFSTGALMVWLVSYQPKATAVLEAASLMGLVLIGYAVLVYDQSTAFPGVSALVPCIGAALVILGGRASYVGKLLCNRVLVGIGLISYSLYLIHWPMYVFYKYWTFRTLTLDEKWGICIASLLVATVMYFYVEKPFRRASARSRWRASEVGLTTALCALLVAFVSANAWGQRGWSWRVDESSAEMLKIARTNPLAGCREAMGKVERRYTYRCRFGDQNGHKNNVGSWG